jgi:hypothetical protein
MKLFDRALCWLIERRMARFTTADDSADRLADRVVALANLLRDELERRNRIHGDWARAARAVQARKAARRQFISSEVNPVVNE